MLQWSSKCAAGIECKKENLIDAVAKTPNRIKYELFFLKKLLIATLAAALTGLRCTEFNSFFSTVDFIKNKQKETNSFDNDKVEEPGIDL